MNALPLSLRLFPGRVRRGATVVLGLAALALLPGCGPGTGGTGIPPTAALTYFGASAANVCTAAFASVLCPASPTSGLPDNSGAVMADFADIPSGGNVSVAFRQNSIELTARCQRLRFQGEWGIAAANDARFFGSYSIDPSIAGVPATLTVQTRGSQIDIVVREADGRLVLGPVLLQQISVPPLQPAPCP